MANKYTIKSYVSFLTTIGKTTRQIYQSIKKSTRFKNTTNGIIAATINAVNLIKSNASRFYTALGNTPVNKIVPPKQGILAKNVTVSFKFKFTFPPGSSSGKVGKQDVYINIDVKGDATKKQILAKIREAINDWINENYGAEGGQATRISYTIKGLEEI